ncbi:MarR family winged helix-turn-helix transcriptional regulator [Clostridium pasteurianum]|uniref:Transcriptional regulator n=1 Tax=Clostridium pasteurianum BC1 TaxID=86416 RepID=R4K9N5_CLOPA|nr:MarR family transcriptional regulator [Clostridium pasteurianum]AGK96355.1 transcriptional regulator [Clostridium pasteurianum BC1]
MELINFARLVGILNRQSQDYMTIAYKSIGISFSECIFLLNLYGNEGINQEKLSSMLLIDKAATARSIKSLEKKGFLMRKISKEDKRAKKLYLTGKGKDCKEQIFSSLRKWIDFLTEGMDKETKNIVFKGLQSMAGRAGNAVFNELLEDKIDDSNKDKQ